MIRPLVYVAEADIIEFARHNAFPIICCACPVYGRTDQQRQRMKQLVREMETEIPHLKSSMLRAMGNVQPRHLLDPYLSRALAEGAGDR